MRLVLLSRYVRRFAKYIPVLAAALIFGSWVLNELLLNKIKDYKVALAAIDGTISASERHDELTRRLGNMHKMLQRTRDLEPPGGAAPLDWSVKAWYHETLKLELSQEVYDDWYHVHGNVNALAELCRSMDAGEHVLRRADSLEHVCDSLYQALVSAGYRKDSILAFEMNGSGIVLESMSSERAIRMTEPVREYNRFVEELTVGHYLGIVNTRYRILSDLQYWAKQELDSLTQLSIIGRWLVLFLYATGTTLTIYAKWLESRTEE